jgi:hypothetical protein
MTNKRQNMWRFIITLLLIFLFFESNCQRKKYFLTFNLCIPEIEGESLNIDTLLSYEDIHPFRLGQVNKRKWRKRVYIPEQDWMGRCATWKYKLKEGHYNFYSVSSIFDTIFIDLKLSKDTVINLHHDTSYIYREVDDSISLLDNLQKGDRISIISNYYDCPGYVSYSKTTFHVVSDSLIKEMKNSYKRNQKPILHGVEMMVNLKILENEVDNIAKGNRLKILIRKNEQYKIYECDLLSFIHLPEILRKINYK